MSDQERVFHHYLLLFHPGFPQKRAGVVSYPGKDQDMFQCRLQKVLDTCWTKGKRDLNGAENKATSTSDHKFMNAYTINQNRP